MSISIPGYRSRSGATRGGAVGHISPEAQAGGKIAHIMDGDVIEIDINKGKINLDVPAKELDKRAKKWFEPHKELSGYLKRYAEQVGDAGLGAALVKVKK